MTLGARSVGISISKIAALVECSRATVINGIGGWIPKQKKGSQCQACSHARLLEVLSERRIVNVVQLNRRAITLQITGNLKPTTHSKASIVDLEKEHTSPVGKGTQGLDCRRLEKIMWSDESRFQLCNVNSRVRIWRK
ncbi:hypothetical protein TNCV_2438721 [Trichonephila clavipes]|nr:hypothetical protein TNCV_2438721 [Trichonephila clavipes]